MFNVQLPPLLPLPPDAAGRRAPSDEEFDEFFARIGDRLKAHPLIVFMRLIVTGAGIFFYSNEALLETLIERRIVDESARLDVAVTANELNAAKAKASARGLLTSAARGFFSVNGKPLSPDDAATISSMFVNDEPDYGAIMSALVKSVLPPEYVTDLFYQARAADDPLKALSEYGVHESPETKIADRFSDLDRRFEALSKGVASRAATAEREITRLTTEVRELTEALERTRREADQLREEVATFRGREDQA